METIKKQLQKLPLEVREKALKNANPAVLDEPCKTVKQALLKAFMWDDTPEQYAFWLAIHMKL